MRMYFNSYNIKDYIGGIFMKYFVLILWLIMEVYLLYILITNIKHFKHYKYNNEPQMVRKIKFIALVTQIPLAIIISTLIAFRILNI